MIQKFVVEVDTHKPLNEYGDGHVLLYNEKSGKYYVTTRENLFVVQDEKIKNLKEDYDKFKKEETEEFEKFKGNILDEVRNFEKSALEREKNFLSQYQETNASLIKMVKKLIIEE